MRKKIGFLFLAVIMLLSFAGCGGRTKKGVEGTLAITVYSAGYGTEWIDEAVRLFKEDNPGVEVDLETSPLAFSSVQTMLENGNCTMTSSSSAPRITGHSSPAVILRI